MGAGLEDEQIVESGRRRLNRPRRQHHAHDKDQPRDD
jgi:hypothetical protein